MSRSAQSNTYYSCQRLVLLREKLVQKKCPSAEGLGIKKLMSFSKSVRVIFGNSDCVTFITQCLQFFYRLR